MWWWLAVGNTAGVVVVAVGILHVWWWLAVGNTAGVVGQCRRVGVEVLGYVGLHKVEVGCVVSQNKNNKIEKRGLVVVQENRGCCGELVV